MGKGLTLVLHFPGLFWVLPSTLCVANKRGKDSAQGTRDWSYGKRIKGPSIGDITTSCLQAPWDLPRKDSSIPWAIAWKGMPGKPENSFRMRLWLCLGL